MFKIKDTIILIFTFIIMPLSTRAELIYQPMDTLTSEELITQIIDKKLPFRIPELQYQFLNTYFSIGGLNINDKVINGDFKAEFLQPIGSSALYFRNVIFEGDVTFKFQTFKRDIVFENVLFRKRLTINTCNFDESIYIIASKICNETDLEHLVITNQLFFDRDTFSLQCKFIDINCLEHATINNTVFSDRALFQYNNYKGPFTFDNSECKGFIDFSIITMDKITYFGNSIFNELSFRNVQIKNRFEFGNVNSNSIVFKDFNLESKSDFSSDSIFKKLIFLNCSFGESTNFYGALFPDTILVDDLSFNRMLIKWSQIEGKIYPVENTKNYGDYASIYYSFINNFRNLGKYSDEDECYYFLKNIELQLAWKNYFKHLTFNPFTWFKPFILGFFKYSCGFWVRPFQVIGISIIAIVICSLFFSGKGAIEERKKEIIPEYNYDYRSKFQRFKDAIYFSVNTFTTVGYGDWYPTKAHIKIGKYKIKFSSVPMFCFGLI